MLPASLSLARPRPRRTEHLLSVGIDVGTTTTQVVFSTLGIQDVAPGSQAPKLAIVSRELRYEGSVHLTPLRDWRELDLPALRELLASEFRRSGLNPSEVRSGAVIITGEAAKLENARQVLDELATAGGDFVVTVAGPSLEAVIAGRGAGAAAMSRQLGVRVANVDVGGGTTNIAVFESGRPVDTAAIAVGGRLAVLSADGTLAHLAEPARVVLRALGVHWEPGQTPEPAQWQLLASALAELCVETMLGLDPSPLARELLLTPPLRSDREGAPAEVYCFSGGVGMLYYQPAADTGGWGDLGPQLAAALGSSALLQGVRVERPPHTIRATVLGAATQTVRLSGSTIWLSERLLPLRDVPVVQPLLPPGAWRDAARLAAAIREGTARCDLAPGIPCCAVALEGPPGDSFEQVELLAAALADAYGGSAQPLVVLLERDLGQVLGQALRQRLSDRPVVVVDQVAAEEGDFVDIGTPLAGGRVVPVSVKTLVFEAEASSRARGGPGR